MSRTAWTRDELSGHHLVFLVDLTFAGVTHRVGTVALTVASDAGSLSYDGTLDDLVWSRALDLFTTDPEPEAVVVSGFIPANVAALQRQGHSLEGSAVQVSQVRVLPGAYGAAADAWEARRVCVSGRVVDSEHGAANEDGRTYVRFSAERKPLDSTTQIPAVGHRVTEDTWKIPGRLGGGDVDLYYPIPIGYPGRDDSIADGWISGSVGRWAVKKRLYNVLILAVGKIEATTVKLNTDEQTTGVDALVSYTYTETTAGNVIASRDARGTLLAVVDYKAHDYGDVNTPADYLGTSFDPEVSSTDEVFVGWPAGSGGILWRGQVLRAAGDVIEWAMEQAGIPVDFGRFTSARPQLDWLKIDTVIDDAVNPVEWVTSEILPLLPVSLVMTEDGVAPWVWNPRATAADAACHLDCDNDPTLDPADTLASDSSMMANDLELRYSYSQRAERFTHTARLGPKRIATTARAKSRLILTRASAYQECRISLFARTSGPAGGGIVVTCTTGATLAVAESGSTVTVVFNTTDNPQAIVNAINAGSVLIEAETDDDTEDSFTGTSTARVTLQIADFGTAGSSILARSQHLLEQGDKAGPGAGIRRRAEETRILYDHGSAAGVLEWWSAAYGLPLRRLAIEAPEASYGWLDLGAVVTVTHTPLGLVGAVGLIEAQDFHSDGMVSLGVLFIDTSAWSAVG